MGINKFLLNEVGLVPAEQYIVDNTPEKYQDEIRQILDETSDKRIIPLEFNPDAGEVQEELKLIEHNGRGLILGAGWDRDLAREKDYDYLSIALPTPYRLVLTTNYVGFSGGLRLIEDIYNGVLSTYA